MCVTVMRSYRLFRLKCFKEKMLLICFICLFLKGHIYHTDCLLGKIWKMNTFYLAWIVTGQVRANSPLSKQQQNLQENNEMSVLTIKTQSFQKSSGQKQWTKCTWQKQTKWYSVITKMETQMIRAWWNAIFTRVVMLSCRFHTEGY